MGSTTPGVVPPELCRNLGCGNTILCNTAQDLNTRNVVLRGEVDAKNHQLNAQAADLAAAQKQVHTLRRTHDRRV